MNFDDIRRRLHEAEGNPELLALATLDFVLSEYPPDIRLLVESAAIPRWFDHEILARMRGWKSEPTADDWATLIELPFIESFQAKRGFNVHQVTRLALRRKIRTENPARFKRLSTIAAEIWNGEDTSTRVEHIYHQLSASPLDGSDLLEKTYWKWRRAGKLERVQQLGAVLDELATFPLADFAKGRVLLIRGCARQSRIPLNELQDTVNEAIGLLVQTGPQSSLADAYFVLGTISEKKGELRAALASFQTAKRIMEALTGAEPTNPDLQRELSVSHNAIGWIYKAQGKLEKALDEFQAARLIREALTVQDPANSDWQRDLSVSHNAFGRIYQSQGKLEKALDEFQADKRIMEGLTAQDPANSDWQREFSVSHYAIGHIYQSQGRLPEALAEFQEYKRIIEALTAMDPANSDWQRDLAMSYSNVGRIYQSQGEYEKALAELQKYKRIMQTLTALDPANFDWQRDLSVAHNAIGSIYQSRGRLTEALTELECDLAIAQRLARLDPTNLEWQEDLRVSAATVEALRKKIQE